MKEKNIVQLKPGSIIKLNFSPSKGHEQKGYRPAIIISNPNTKLPLNNMVAVAPITNTQKGFPTHVNLDNFCSTTGVIMLEHLRWIDLGNRPYSYVEEVSDETLKSCFKISKILLFDEE